MFWRPRWYGRRFYRRAYPMWGRPWRRRPFFVPGCGCFTLLLMLFGLAFLAILTRI